MNRKFKYLKENSLTTTVYKILDCDIDLFYSGKYNTFDPIGKVYVNRADALRAMSQLNNNFDNCNLKLIRLIYKLKDIIIER